MITTRPFVAIMALALLALLPSRAADGPRSSATSANELAAKLTPTRQVTYKSLAGRELQLHVFEPADLKRGDRRAVFINFHGGGWGAGNPRVMYPFAAWAAKWGLVGISVQYRLFKPGTDDTVWRCVQDARSAVRYVRAQAAALGVDSERIIVGGASAGGHLAIGTALFTGVDEPGENRATSCRPDALVLFSPVIDTSAEGYGQAKLGERWRELSPLHRVQKELPPTVVFHGTGDKTTPFIGAQRFHDAMVAAGNRCDLIVERDAQHTYMFKDERLYADTQRRLAAFLESIGFLPLAAQR